MFRRNKKEKTVENKFYNIFPVIKQNALITLIIGTRGIGKTRASWDKLLWPSLKSGRDLVYIRRLVEERDAVAEGMVEELINEGFSDVELVGGKKGYPIIYIGGVKRIYFVNLRSAPLWKGYCKLGFPNVEYIFFDEVSSDTGIYIKNEFKLFHSIVETFTRHFTHKRVLLLSNSNDIFSPILEKFNLKYEFPQGNEIRVWGKEIAIESCITSEELKALKKETPAHVIASLDDKLIEYVYDNKFSFNNMTGLLRFDKNILVQPLFKLWIDEIELNLWEIIGGAYYFCLQPINNLIYGNKYGAIMNKCDVISDFWVRQIVKKVRNKKVFFQLNEQREIISQWLAPHLVINENIVNIMTKVDK